MWMRVFGLVTTLKLWSEKYFETTLGTSGSISAMVSFWTAGSIDTAPAVTPAPQPMTSAFFGSFGIRVVRWPSIRCRRMSCGSLEACTLPALW